MKIVIDANMIIAALVKDSKAREIIMSNKFEFVSPDFVFDEIYKYESEICEKAGLTKDEFELLMALIFEKITIITADEYEAYKENAKAIMKEDVKDVPYVACYLALNCNSIWTNDPDYEGKKEIRVFSTAELLKLMEQ
ncbi:MAG: PIN domain-containing protein [Euryarchaeota archaeon]|nr:PIN domain-containing protein [Euryarchaeota archaeon]